MRNARPTEAGTSAPDKRDSITPDRWHVAHAMARRIPALPEQEKRAAVSLLLSSWLDLLRMPTS
jgi:hypothetical protein